MDKNKRFSEIAEKIKKLTVADDFRISYNAEANALTRFASNMVTQNIDVERESVDFTAYFGAKKATVSSANLTDEGLKSMVASCEATARLSVEDKEYMPTLGKADISAVAPVDQAIASMTPADRAAYAKIPVERAQKDGVTVSGSVSNGLFSSGVSTKNGAHMFFETAVAAYSNTVDNKGEKGNAGVSTATIGPVNAEKLYNEAFQDALLSQNPREFEPGRYTVLFSAHAAAQLLVYMAFYGADKRAVDEGYSPYVGKMGQKIGDSRVTIYTDPSDIRAVSQPFTGEGMPVNKRKLFENGNLVDLPCSRFWANKTGAQPWGLTNFVMNEGTKTEAELLKGIERGFYIKDLWYIRMVKMDDFTLTGMTRNGFFYIEDGKIACGSKHFRWNDSPMKMLDRIVELGKGAGEIDSWYSVFAPAMVVKDFYLSSKTLF